MGRLERGYAPDARTPEQAFGIALRAIRRKLGRSQQWLADKSGYHRTYIGLLEQGHKSPSLRTTFNIATTLQVKPSEIIEEVERLLGHSTKIKARKR
ncbi:MAG: helix-turn-helix transcriptional regulator [Acidobacteria bacterium]|nr:helix-turn-helix transcriptional regulator [Acidobacteriota bacterium]